MVCDAGDDHGIRPDQLQTVYAEVEQRYSYNVWTVPVGGRRTLYDRLLRTTGAASGALDAPDSLLPGGAVEWECSPPRGPHQQARRRSALQVRLYCLIHLKSVICQERIQVGGPVGTPQRTLVTNGMVLSLFCCCSTRSLRYFLFSHYCSTPCTITLLRELTIQQTVLVLSCRMYYIYWLVRKRL